jgi:hypothetical protein
VIVLLDKEKLVYEFEMDATGREESFGPRIDMENLYLVQKDNAVQSM